LGVVVDRAKEKVCVIASPEGGVEIEEVARKNPDLVMMEYVDTFLGLSDYKSRKIAKFLGIPVQDIVKKLVKIFFDLDLSLCEINPLVQTEDGKILALDAKINFDDNALFRHPQIANFMTRMKMTHEKSKQKKSEYPMLVLREI